MDIKKLVGENFDLAVKLRRHLHEHPELTGEEYNTVAYVLKQLKAFGIDAFEVPDGGVLALIKGEKPTADGSRPKRVLLRADVDALPIDEPEENLSKQRVCRSKVPGVMHACGHDSHTAMLIVAGKILSENRDKFSGEVLLCFERGEEGGGNIKYLVKHFADNDLWYDSAFGMHVEQKMPSGEIAILDGGVNAASVPIDIKITGSGGHGSRPDLSNNPIDCMYAILGQIYNIRMKYISPFEQVTVSVCTVHAGSKSNIIPDVCEIGGSARCFSMDGAIVPFREELTQICKSCGEMTGCDVEVKFRNTLPRPVVNNPHASEVARQAVVKHLGPQALGTTLPAMGSESFSQYGLFAPAVFANLGIANEEVGAGAELHNRLFDLDEEAMKVGIGAHIAYALEFFEHEGSIDFTPTTESIAQITGL